MVDAVVARLSFFEEMQQRITSSIALFDDMNKAIQQQSVLAANAVERTNGALKKADGIVQQNEKAQKLFNFSLKDAEKFAGNLIGKLNSITKLFGFEVNKKSVADFFSNSIDMANKRIQAEQKLANVVAKRGLTEADFAKIKQNASAIQNTTVYDTASMYGVAGELTKHIKDAGAINKMMGSVANYAAGMSGGGAVGFEKMLEYASQLGSVLEGKFDGFGFEITEAQEKIIKTGSDMEKARVVEDIINQSWGNLANKMANTPQGMMISMTNAFNDIRTSVGVKLLDPIMKVYAVIQKHMPKIKKMLLAFVPVIQTIIERIGNIVDAAFHVYGFFVNNWALIETVAWRVAAAFSGLLGFMIVAKFAWIEPVIWGIAIALAAWTAATWLLTAVNWALVASILANPYTWVVVVIGAVIGAIVALADSVGGFRVLWLNFVNNFLTALDMMMLGFLAGIHWVLDLWDKLELRFLQAKVAILDFMGDMKTDVLMILQNMVNGGIEIINRFIGRLRTIPGVKIDFIEQVSFGTQAKLQNEAEKKARESDVANAKAKVDAAVAGRAEALDAMVNWAQSDRRNRMKEIEATQDALQEQEYNKRHKMTSDYVTKNLGKKNNVTKNLGNNNEDMLGNIARKADEIAGNTKQNADLGDEDLKYLRDIAERDAINRFTTAEIHIEQHNENHISSKLDLDGIINSLAAGTREAVEESAEGVHM